MGNFVNPDNSAFQVALNSEIYVDKTDMICYTNRVMGTKQCLICNSRPRRFGKSTTADMLAAYYSKGCDSSAMFAGRKVSKGETYHRHLNQYDVIHIDVQWCRVDAGSADGAVPYIVEHILEELKEIYPEALTKEITSLPHALMAIHHKTGSRFIIIIDEWDALIRDEAGNPKVQEAYINLLRGLFKGTQPTKFLCLAYLTGILPIKKIKTQSALNNFDEFTMLDAKMFAPYMGLTEGEVRGLCQKYDRDFEEVKRWYDGYLLSREHLYNPKAVVSLMLWGEFQSYWSQTGTYEAILPLINLNFDGLRAAVISMLSGDAVEIEVSTYQNDMVTFADKDDVLTLLVHLGYLAYHKESRTACIPNEEIRSEFVAAVKRNKWNEFLELQRKSEELLCAKKCKEHVCLIEKWHT